MNGWRCKVKATVPPHRTGSRGKYDLDIRAAASCSHALTCRSPPLGEDWHLCVEWTELGIAATG